MSNPSTASELPCDIRPGCAALQMLIHPVARELGGFSVRRSLPNRQRRMIGPWIFFDHMGPADFPAGQGINVRPHPHIGLATVTYLFEGEMLHRDSLGSVQLIRPGDLNLMVCGRGIVHSERQRPEVLERPQRLHGLQLWLALPQADEEIEPSFHHYPAGALPATEVDGVPLRLMMGEAYGLRSPVRRFAETLYVEAALAPGQSLALPDAEQRGLYVAEGELRIGDTLVPQYAMAVLSAADGLRIEATGHARVVLIGGEDLGERHIDWNFVSSRRERIAQAREDWAERRFPSIPGDDQEFIPLPGRRG